MLNKAVVSLKAIRENALKIKQKLGNTKLCAVVKADAYGHGACVVANAIYHIADCYAVALPEEAFALRNAGIDKDILVLLPVCYKEMVLCITNKLTLTVENANQLMQIEKCASRLGVMAKVHVKVNTGMNRLGLDVDELSNFLSVASHSLHVSIEGVYSHYGNPQDNLALQSATDKFLLANSMVKGYNNKATAHISASGGFLCGKYFDMVRIGILLYGYKPFDHDFKVKPAMRVYAPIINKRTINKGQNLLYGNYTVNEQTNVDLVRYGYADGLPRIETQGQFNNRCMDLTAVKVCGKDFYPVMTDADKVAKQYQTISYEVLVKCAMRAEKIYVN